MDKLTTERLEYYAALPTQPADGDGFFKKGIFMYEVRRMARQLLAYEQAAKNPVAWDYEWASYITCEGPQDFNRIIEREAPPDWAIDEGQARNIIPLYAAPVLPKQPETQFDEIALDTAREIMRDVNQRHELIGGECQLLARIQCRINDVLCNVAAPAQPVIPEQSELRYGDNVLWFLNELAAFDASDIDSDDFDVYGEDRNGMEGCATISITELAADAAKLLSAQPVSEPYKLPDERAKYRVIIEGFSNSRTVDFEACSQEEAEEIGRDIFHEECNYGVERLESIPAQESE